MINSYGTDFGDNGFVSYTDVKKICKKHSSLNLIQSPMDIVMEIAPLKIVSILSRVINTLVERV